MMITTTKKNIEIEQNALERQSVLIMSFFKHQRFTARSQTTPPKLEQQSCYEPPKQTAATQSYAHPPQTSKAMIVHVNWVKKEQEKSTVAFSAIHLCMNILASVSMHVESRI